MRLLGHKNIKNTLIYTQLIDFQEEDSFVSKIAQNIEEASKLIEEGFEYVCHHEGSMLLRKGNSLWKHAEKPGMGVEPIYSCSAGNRLNRSATPAI